ncbi:DUF6002 family protein [Actinocatenispora sera]|uniref:Uncharacterized protein n=1 Tax=Actinocatenispora sera TaxID=390989 RepID=A0A810L1F1_9ACTN|nr:DUF6002 family protein [Actinocatenispora sera]BCJ28482.1 hypothetical protein Asera_25900 [Actinocatenispora sera]
MSHPPTANLILDYYDRLPEVVAARVHDPSPVTDPVAFSPGFRFPELDDGLREFFSVATACWWQLGEHDSHRLQLLDLTRAPGTRTTKTLASLLIVARAVEFIRQTGEPVLIFTPTSANKGTALRDAVQRAIRCGLVTPDQLRVAIVAPASCLPKLRGGLSTGDVALDPRRHPIFLYDGESPEGVKALAREFADRYAGKIGAHLWFSLELRNYLVADAARAFFEHDVAPTVGAAPRWHAHAVSSAFGLLGYNLGRDVLEERGMAEAAQRPGFLLVQHLDTPDMVLSLRRGGFDRSLLPTYRYGGGLYRQEADPHFPAATFDPDEVLDPTFYSHAPATSPAMNELIARYGGDGVVVSLYECLQRYPQIRELLAATDRPVPADPRRLREFSLVMALTGVLNAVQRRLVPDGTDLVVHASGSYTVDDYPPLAAADTVPVRSVADIAKVLLGTS